jgi:hypothetical protein
MISSVNTRHAREYKDLRRVFASGVLPSPSLTGCTSDTRQSVKLGIESRGSKKRWQFSASIPPSLRTQMNLSFLPGDLHLSQDDEGSFVLRLAGHEILNTKSQRAALTKFNALRTELEMKFPVREPTAEEKAELLQREIKDSLLQHNFGSREKDTLAAPQLSTAALFEVEAALKAYYAAVETSDLTQSSQATYIDMANNFVRWLRGDFNPGSRKEPYRAKRAK